MTRTSTFSTCIAACAAVLALGGCSDATSTTSTDPLAKEAKLRNRSVTPALVKAPMIPGVEIFPLISSDDTLEESPNFTFGGSADGMGLLKNSNKSFTLIVNHEDNFSVSRVQLDKHFKPVKGEYIMTSDDGRFRLCSATLTDPQIHGFGPVFLTAGESGEESMTHAIDPKGAAGQSNVKPALGHWSAENTVPLPVAAYSNRSVIMIGDDDSGPYGGQLAMYVSSTGDLDNGNLYVLARTDNNIRERDMVPGVIYNVDFRQIPNQKTLTGAQINVQSAALNSMRFGRVEDIDYRKGSGGGREVYFNVTGQATTGANSDYSRSKYGRVYRLILDPNDPTRGTLEVILDGDDRSGIARAFQNPDNICVTRNYVYIQEDPNGYGDETHDSYIYQYSIATKQLRPVLELDHRRHDPYYGGNSRFGAWEYGAMIDISDLVEYDNTFAIAIQPHTWTGERYRNPDGGSLRPNENQASQILIVKGLPR